jgi:hypothetical protein
MVARHSEPRSSRTALVSRRSVSHPKAYETARPFIEGFQDRTPHLNNGLKRSTYTIS